MTRDELRRQLWPADTFVDFEHGLNAAIKRLRVALGDSVDMPRFVETIPRHGYRFIAPVRPSVAVLPFVNLTGDADNEHFIDGIAEDVIAQLSHVRALKVISRRSVMPFKTRPDSLREIADQLGVATVLDGSVRRSGDRVRIVAELIDVARDEPLWTETYDRQLTDIFAVQRDVALRIVAALRAELTREGRGRVDAEPERSVDAFRLFVQGTHCLSRFTQEGLLKSLDYFSRAVAQDPNCARVYAGMARSYIMLGMGYGSTAMRPGEAHPLAKQAIARALALDPSLAEAHGINGFVKFVADFDWAGAEHDLKSAIALMPGDSMSHDLYGLLLAALERYDEAIVVQRRAQELDPLSAVCMSNLATTLLRAGRYNDALSEARRVTELEPGHPMGHSTLGWALLKTGLTAEGLASLNTAVAVSGRDTMMVAQLGQAYALAGRESDAGQLLRDLAGMARHRYVSPYHLAYIYTGLGRFEKAIDLLEEAIAVRAGGAYGIKGSFLFAPLRSQPRFKMLLQKLHLQDES